jgi:hypothetical protein
VRRRCLKVAGRRLRLTDKFAEVIELQWSEFIKIEDDADLDNLTYLVVILVRSCVKGDMRAIRESLDRMDGKVITEVEIEYPRFYILFPNAKSVVTADNDAVAELPIGDIIDIVSDEETPLPTGSLREVLNRMLDAKRTLPDTIIDATKLLDIGNISAFDPLVKSAIIAGLMKLVHKGRVNAVIEILDQIDGKVKEHVKVLGGDIVIKNFAPIAPEGATLNDDGVYQISSPIVTDTWAARLESRNKR